MVSNKLSRQGDQNQAGGKIVKGASTVFCNNKPVGLHVSQITPHAPYGFPHPPHHNSKTIEGSPTVFVENCAVLRVTSATTCGHKIIEGSDNVFVP